MTISGTTRVVGLIGADLRGSPSPAMHNAGFSALGLDLVYVPFPLGPCTGAQVEATVTGLVAAGVKGFNVTAPHKQAVAAAVDELAPPADRVDAVNTVVVEGGRTIGHNTDVEGFVAGLDELLRAEQTLPRSNCLLLGAGGAARAVVAALVEERVAGVTVLARDPAKAARSLETLSTGRTVVEAASLTDAFDRAAGVDLLVGCTPPEAVDELVAPLVHRLPKHAAVVDINYHTAGSRLVTAARDRGLAVQDGRAMLFHQGAAAFRLWTGCPPPLQVMRRALDEDLARRIRRPQLS